MYGKVRLKTGYNVYLNNIWQTTLTHARRGYKAITRNQRKRTVTLIELQICLGLKLVGNICDNVSTQFNNTYNIALVETV